MSRIVFGYMSAIVVAFLALCMHKYPMCRYILENLWSLSLNHVKWLPQAIWKPRLQILVLENMCNYEVSNVYANGIAQIDVGPSAGTAMTKSGSRL